MIEHVWYHDENDKVHIARLLNLGAYNSEIEYFYRGMTWNILADNDDIEFIGDNRLDDDQD